MFVIVDVTEMESLLLYVARNNEHTNRRMEDYQRHCDGKQRHYLSYLYWDGCNSSSYSTINTMNRPSRGSPLKKGQNSAYNDGY